MKLKTLLLAMSVSFAVSTHAAEKPVLKEGIDAEVKAVIEAAQAANKAATEANTQWVWADPVDGLWEGTLRFNSEILDQAIVMANEGKLAEAKKTAAFIEMAATNGVKQAELAKSAGPKF